MLSFVAKVGDRTTSAIAELGEVFLLLGRTLSFVPRIRRDKRLLLDQMAHIGTDSLPLVAVIGFFTGMVSAWQAAYQLEGFIPFSFIGSAVSRAIFIELGPVLTAIVIAGRVGASIAAELGTMKVTEQIDALESLAISPIRYLSTPRVVAATVMLPILTIFANAIALIGALIVCNVFLDLTAKTFFTSVQSMFALKDVIGGLIKAVVFGMCTALIGVHVGFKTSGGAEGVGQATIRSFVLSSATVLVLDYILWVIIFNA